MAVQEKAETMTAPSKEAVADAVRAALAENGSSPEAVDEIMKAHETFAEAAKKSEEEAAKNEKDRAAQKKDLEKALDKAGKAQALALKQSIYSVF